MKVSIIIPVAKRHRKYLKRCLLSILDQDYDEWEVIVSYDGEEGVLPIKDDRIKSIGSKVSLGASAARNAGEKEIAGKLLYFFDADCTLFPGMLSLMVDKLESEKVDFVYSGYRYNVPGTMNVYPSRPFDPYLLESMNYISTMSLMKREVFESIGGFDEDLPFFQDWDFWLRAVKKGAIGYFLKDPTFETEPSDDKSISGSSEYSFRDKVLRIESKHNMASRDLCLTTLAASVQTVERAKVLNARYLGTHQGSQLVQFPSMFDFGFKAVLLMGFFPENIDGHMSVFPKNCRKMICWIGTDVWQLRNKFNWENLKKIKEDYLSEIDKQFSNSPELQEELRELGIETEVLYQPLTENVKVYKLPKRKIVSAYFNEGHPLHNKWYLQDIAKAMPDISFKFYGSDFECVKEGNIEYVGWKPIDEIVKSCRVHLRLTGHDGFPHTPVYHLLGGRRVVCNFPLKFADFVDAAPNESNWEQLKSVVVGKLREQLAKPALDAQEVKEIREYYYDLTSVNNYIKTIEEAVDESQCRDAELQHSSLSGKFY